MLIEQDILFNNIIDNIKNKKKNFLFRNINN